MTFRHMGSIEGKITVYSWINEGKETQPYFTYREAQAFARRYGEKAVFEDRAPNKILTGTAKRASPELPSGSS